MARVNHKLVKKLLNEQRSKITDKQFFTSRTLAGHFEDMAAAQTRRYHYNRRVRVQLAWNPEASDSANTNNEVININAGHTMVTQEKGRQNRYQMVCGLFAHELGHVLYTDFLAPQTQMNYLERGLWYPDPPALRTSAEFANEKALWAYIKADDKNLEAVKTVAHDILNILEDGYVENRMLTEFPGTLGFALETMRMGQLKEMSTVTQMKEAEEDGRFHILDSLLLAMLDYVKFGEIRYGDEPLSDLRIQTIFGLINELDRAVSEHPVKARLDACNLFLVRCWEYIQDYCEQIKAHMDDEDTESLGEKVAKRLGILPGTTAAGVGGVPAAGSTGASAAPATAASRAKTHAEAKEADTENSRSEDGDADSAPEDDPEQTMLMGGSSGTGKQDVSSEEGGRIPYHQTDSVSEPVGGTTEYNADYEREQYDKAASDIERVLDKMAERAACEQLENDRLRELNEMANNISYGDIHKGVHMRINRIASVDEELVEQYDSIAAPLLTISRQLQRSITQELKEHRRGGKQTGLVMGRRLDTHALCRNDGKVFYKNALPNEIPELAVGLLVDESGSMWCADRATYARAAAIILHDFCEGLEIPVMVYGHSTGRNSHGNTVEMYSYAEFEGFDRDDKYRLMDISARDSNRDGAALRYVAEKLSSRPEAVKLLILVSDGQPADTGYSGTAAEEDLRGIKQEYQRKGVVFVAAAIGEDKPSIQRIYGDSFLDITDLEKLPGKLTSVVKKHLRI